MALPPLALCLTDFEFRLFFFDSWWLCFDFAIAGAAPKPAMRRPESTRASSPAFLGVFIMPFLCDERGGAGPGPPHPSTEGVDLQVNAAVDGAVVVRAVGGVGATGATRTGATGATEAAGATGAGDRGATERRDGRAAAAAGPAVAAVGALADGLRVLDHLVGVLVVGRGRAGGDAGEDERGRRQAQKGHADLGHLF